MAFLGNLFNLGVPAKSEKRTGPLGFWRCSCRESPPVKSKLCQEEVYIYIFSPSGVEFFRPRFLGKATFIASACQVRGPGSCADLPGQCVPWGSCILQPRELTRPLRQQPALAKARPAARGLVEDRKTDLAKRPLPQGLNMHVPGFSFHILIPLYSSLSC